MGAPEKQRADPAVLRSLCSHVLPSGHLEVLVSRFESWAGVNADPAMQFDWDDAAGNAARRSAGLRLEEMRKVRSWGCSGAACGLSLQPVCAVAPRLPIRFEFSPSHMTWKHFGSLQMPMRHAWR